jgi:two-component system response regulator YesN
VAEFLRNQLVIESLSHRVRMALVFVEKQYADPKLRLDSVAEHVRVSSHHLSSLIKKETGKGFRHHLIQLRLKTALVLLTTSCMSIKEISTLVGYSSTSSFDREFRRNFECSPTEVRRQDGGGLFRGNLS